MGRGEDHITAILLGLLCHAETVSYIARAIINPWKEVRMKVNPAQIEIIMHLLALFPRMYNLSRLGGNHEG